MYDDETSLFEIGKEKMCNFYLNDIFYQMTPNSMKIGQTFVCIIKKILAKFKNCAKMLNQTNNQGSCVETTTTWQCCLICCSVDLRVLGSNLGTEIFFT